MVAGSSDKAKPATRVLFFLAPASSLPQGARFDVSQPTLRDAISSLVQQCLSQDRLQKKSALGVLTMIIEQTPNAKHAVTDDPTFVELCANNLGSVDAEVRLAQRSFCL